MEVKTYNFGGVFVVPSSSEISFEHVEQILMKGDVIIQVGHLGEFNLFHKTDDSMLILKHSIPRSIVLTIGLMDITERSAAFSYWYNQFDPELKEFDEIKYLFNAKKTHFVGEEQE